jgi:hypothetical protein
MRLPARAPPRTVVRREPWQWDCGGRLISFPLSPRSPGQRSPYAHGAGEGSNELRRILREGGRAIASNDTAGASGYAPLSPTEALVLDVEGFLNSGGCITDIARSRTRRPCQSSAWTRRLRPLRMLCLGDSAGRGPRLPGPLPSRPPRAEAPSRAARVSHLGRMRLIARRADPTMNEDMPPQSKAVSCGPGARGGGHGPCVI